MSETLSITAPWSVEGTNLVTTLWKRILNFCKEEGISTKVGDTTFSSAELPKDIHKVAYMVDLLKLVVEFDPYDLGTQNVREWMDHVMSARGTTKLQIGKTTVEKMPSWKTANEKARGIFVGKAQPIFTPIAQNYDYRDVVEHMDVARKEMLSLVWHGSEYKEDLMDEWNLAKVHGFFNPFFLFGNTLAVASNDTPWSQGDSPMPEDAMVYGAKQVLTTELGFSENPTTRLKPAHLLNGSLGASDDYENGTGVIRYNNKGGAAGHPWSNDAKARKHTSDGRRPTKANTFQEDVKAVLRWIQKGYPMSGRVYEELVQPTGLWWRGDATVNYDLLILAKAMLSKGNPLLLWLLGGRGIAITSSRLVILESMIGQPLQAILNPRDVRQWDLRSSLTTQSAVGYGGTYLN